MDVLANRTVSDEWSEIPFAQLLSEPIRNGIYKKKEFHGSGVKVVNMGELFANPRLRDVHMRRVELSESEQSRFQVQAGDLLFARRSLVAEGAGKCIVVLEINELTAFESSIIRARPDQTKSDSLFLYYYFNSPIGLHLLDTIRRQVAVAGITGTDLAQLPVKVPPLPEQRRIAHILGTLDDKIELNRRMNATLEEMARALFNSWFVNFEPVRAKMEGRWRRGETLPGMPAELYDLFPKRLVASEIGDIPEGWEIGKLGELATFIKGRSYKSAELAESDTALVSLKSFRRGGGYQSEGLKPYTGRFRDDQVIEPGEVVIACTDVTQAAEVVGKPAMVQQDLSYNRFVASLDTMIVRPNIEGVSNELLYFLCGTKRFSNYTYAHTTGTTVLHLVKDAIPMFQLAIPPVEIMLAFEEFSVPLCDRKQSISKADYSLTILRDSLLPKLVSEEVQS